MVLLQHVYQWCCWNVLNNVVAIASIMQVVQRWWCVTISMFINGVIAKHQWCNLCNVGGGVAMSLFISGVIATLVVLLQCQWCYLQH